MRYSAPRTAVVLPQFNKEEKHMSENFNLYWAYTDSLGWFSVALPANAVGILRESLIHYTNHNLPYDYNSLLRMACKVFGSPSLSTIGK